MARKAKELLDNEARYHPETGEILNGLARSLLSNDGRLEYPDPMPMEASVQLPPESGMRRLVQQMIRQEMSQLADSMEMETFEEADDFDIEDDPLDPLTEYEKIFEPAAGDVATPSGNGGHTGGVPSSGAPLSSNGDAGGPNVKRSEGNDPAVNNATADHPGPNGARSGDRASEPNQGRSA